MQSTQNKIQVGIIGGAGYTAGELIRILLNHPYVSIKFINSESFQGHPISVVHQDLYGETDIKFTSSKEHKADIVFLCQGHGQSVEVLSSHKFGSDVKFIDLGNDFRLKADAHFNSFKFIYGLPELNKLKIKNARCIANPGCFATAIQLALLPLAEVKKIESDVHIHAITGSTGAGQSPSNTTHFSWRNNNVSVYKAFEHQHLGEIGESLFSLQGDFNQELNFIPIRGNFTRGILSTIYLDSNLMESEAIKIYESYYNEHPFVHLSGESVHLKQVINSNKCVLKVEKKGSKLLITSVIDNLIKGASGQAVQNMNLMYGLDETQGLQLKTVAF